MECPKRIALKNANAALARAGQELRAVLQEPDQALLPTATNVLLGHDTDQAIRQMYHDLQLTQIKTNQELEHHRLTCENCLQD